MFTHSLFQFHASFDALRTQVTVDFDLFVQLYTNAISHSNRINNIELKLSKIKKWREMLAVHMLIWAIIKVASITNQLSNRFGVVEMRSELVTVLNANSIRS